MASGAAGVPYCGAAPHLGEIWTHWNLDPVLLLALALLGCGWWLQRPARHRASLSFWAGYAALIIAFVSPLCALSSGLFAARSLHHLAIVAVAAPLIGSVLPAGRTRFPLALMAVLHVATFWAWHVPGLYSAALSDTLLYWVMQLSLLSSGIFFWSALFRSESGGAQLAALGVMVLQMGLLGAIITFAPQPLYVPHFATASLYGLTPLEDQQLAGLIMWVGSLPLTVLAGLPIILRRLAPRMAAA